MRHGTLIIAGGGTLPSSILQTFVEHAGGVHSKIVYIPCSEQPIIEEEPVMLETLRKAGAGDVCWLHTKDRTLADDPISCVRSRMPRAYGLEGEGNGILWILIKNTEAHRLMHEVLKRGGVIAGSSAGASIQGDYMPRGNPLGNRDIMAEGYERGFGFLPGVAIDQHFAQRKRFPDMMALKKTYPQLLGIGIDEKTAIVVKGEQAEIVGEGRVAFFDRHQPTMSPGIQAYHRKLVLFDEVEKPTE